MKKNDEYMDAVQYYEKQRRSNPHSKIDESNRIFIIRFLQVLLILAAIVLLVIVPMSYYVR